MKDEFCLAISSISKSEEASRIAELLVNEGLAACVHIAAGGHSVYRWEGRLCTDTEHLLFIKTSAKRLDELKARLLEVHSYDTPEFIVASIDDISSGYADWIRASLKTEPSHLGEKQ